MSDKWHFQPELLFTSIGCNWKNDGFLLKGGHVKIYALELPLNMSFRPKITRNTNLIINMGPYIRYGLFGNKTYEHYDIPLVDESPFDAYNRFDGGLNFGLGLQQTQYYTILSFQRSVSYAEKGGGYYHQSFKLSIGYNF